MYNKGLQRKSEGVVEERGREKKVEEWEIESEVFKKRCRERSKRRGTEKIRENKER